MEWVLWEVEGPDVTMAWKEREEAKSEGVGEARGGTGERGGKGEVRKW